MSTQTPLPDFYDPTKVGSIFEPNYEMLSAKGPGVGKQYGIKPAVTDRCALA